MLSRFERFFLNITEINLYLYRLSSEVMKPYGIKGSSWIYLTKLYDNPEGYSSSELCYLCCKDKADVSRDIRALEKQGIITRKSNGIQSYRVPIKLTDLGKKLAEQIINKAEIAVNFIGNGIEDSERDIFYSSLEKISSNMQILSESDFPFIENANNKEI